MACRPAVYAFITIGFQIFLRIEIRKIIKPFDSIDKIVDKGFPNPHLWRPRRSLEWIELWCGGVDG
jgi:hypothetical protein